MESLNFSFPSKWEDLSNEQLKYIFKLIAKGYPFEKIKIFSLFKWNKVRLLARKGDGSYILSAKTGIPKKIKLFEVKPIQFAEVFPFLAWIDRVPDYPVAINRIAGRKAINAFFQEVPFEKFIMADNLYQGYLATENEEILDQLATVLYPSVFPQGKLKQWQRVAVFYWFNSLKNFFSLKFNEFFQPASCPDISFSSENSVEASMNAQIRALTKGDVTKEKEVLKLDTWRALEELNAQAREYREFNQKYNKK